LILIDTSSPHWYPHHDAVAGVVYTSHPTDVSHVFVEGKRLLSDGELLTLDEERIRYEAERRAFRMVGTPMARMRDYDA
jgi:5-methylthioadenosine/S-adenosylhomocysteine deaminase